MDDRVNGLRPLPADGIEASWAAGDAAGDAVCPEAVEQVSLRWENEAWTVSGRLRAHRVEYVIRLSPLWHVRQFMLFRDLDQPDLWLGTDGNGRWGEVNGAHRPELDGAYDVAVLDAVFPVALPIRRLPIAVGEAVTLTALTIDVETLAIEPQERRYERLAERRWRVTDVDPHSGMAELLWNVDEYGLPTAIGDLRRVV